MVTKNLFFPAEEFTDNFPKGLINENELVILYELGLEKDEIEYLFFLKTKKKASHKWAGED